MKMYVKRLMQVMGLYPCLKVCKSYICHALGLIVKPRYLGFSQAGEDIILNFLFNDMNIKLEDIRYLDIGACHPFSGNNTYFLYRAGSKGVLVEPTRDFYDDFRKIRPKDVFLNLCVTPNEDQHFVNLYYGTGASGSTIDEVEAKKREDQGGSFTLVEAVEAITINKIIDKYFVEHPQFLSIDIEGVDLPVLKTLDFEKYRIPVILVETCLFSRNHVRPKDYKIFEFMNAKGYVVYADTYINTIFVNKAWFNQGLKK